MKIDANRAKAVAIEFLKTKEWGEQYILESADPNQYQGAVGGLGSLAAKVRR